MANLMNFKGKKILVTGAGRGIGLDIAKTLYELGAEVYALSRSKAPLDDLKAKCPKIHVICVDIENWDETRKAVQSIGPVDAAVNNAAILYMVPLIDCSPEQYEKIWKINVSAVLNISQVVAKGMIERGKGGTIVNISSVSSKIGVSAVGMYASCKAALDRLTQSMALEWGPYGIRANTVNPTGVETDMIKDFMENKPAMKAVVDRIPLGRILKVDDVTKTVLFMLSDLSEMISGESIFLDGGYSCS